MSKITDMAEVFKGCQDFDEDLNGWYVSNVVTMQVLCRASLVAAGRGYRALPPCRLASICVPSPPCSACGCTPRAGHGATPCSV